MDDEACIDDDMADCILQYMLTRLTDKIPPVRVQAVYALSRYKLYLFRSLTSQDELFDISGL